MESEQLMISPKGIYLFNHEEFAFDAPGRGGRRSSSSERLSPSPSNASRRLLTVGCALWTTFFGVGLSSSSSLSSGQSNSRDFSEVPVPAVLKIVETCKENLVKVNRSFSHTSSQLTNMADAYAEIDKRFGTDDVTQVYTELKGRYDKGDRDKEMLWRLGRACHELASKTADKNKKKALIVEGQGYCVEAYKIDSTSFQILKYAAATTGQLTEHLGTKEKIEQGHKFKEYLDKALAIDRKEYTLLHMRGRFAFEVAGLTWLERKVAATFFANPPTATYEEALADLLAVHELRPDWLENVYFIAKTYDRMKDKPNTRKYCAIGLALTSHDEAETEMQAHMEKMNKK